MRIGRQALAVDFLAEIVQLLLAQPAFEEGARIDAGRGVALDVDQVAAVLSADGACQKWLKPTSYRVAADAKLAIWPPSSEDVLVGAHHHRHRVPAHVGADAVFELVIAG